MIGYATLGTNDLDRALAFWDGVIAALGGRRLSQLPDARGFTLYGVGRGRPMLAITRPLDGQAATPGNGSMLALAMDSEAQVAAIHAAALSLGATDEGAPGPRGGAPAGFFGAYFRDTDGNKICLYTLG